MPKAKKQPVAPIAPTPVQEVQPPPPVPTPTIDLPIIYDRVDATEYSTAVEGGPLTIDDMKTLLGWETEKEFQKRRVEEDTADGKENCKPEHYLYGEDYHRKNIAGEKVRCRNNLNNRPFDEKWCDDLIHTILSGQWAGPFTIPGETVNGETIRISKHARCMSGQHQMTACIIAGEVLLRDRENGLDHPDSPKYPAWVKHGQPFLETFVITGLSEDPRILMTVDYVKPRTIADIFYTSATYKEIVEVDGTTRKTTNQERQELCRILATACDFLWTRTDAAGYRTHLEVVGFLERHPRLLQCVEHLFKLNRATKSGGRKISNLRLSPGQCAALMYVMGCSAVTPEDSDGYRNMDPAPSEKNDKGKDVLDWSYWDKAIEFWVHLAGSPSDLSFMQVRKALGQLITSDADSEDNKGMGGRLNEKLAILAKAWERWKDHPENAGPPFDNDDLIAPDGCLVLNYVDCDEKGVKYPDGQIGLVDIADFFGIDSPQVKSINKRTAAPEPPPIQYTEEEMEKMKEDARMRRQQTTAGK